MTCPTVRPVVAFSVFCLACFAADEIPVVFRSDVSLVRVDAQVVERRDNRAVTGLQLQDFILRDQGKQQPIQSLANEDMAVDVLLLLDVSGSMQSHLERVAGAARTALDVLGKDDRVAVMAFNRSTRLRLPFRSNRQEVQRELEDVLRSETFDGGTDITRALFDAAAYIGREGRRDARRAIVIVTDDQTERGRDDDRIIRALNNSGTVLSVLLAPDAMVHRRGTAGGGGGWPPSGGGGPMGGPSIGGGPLGGIILGRRPPYGGGSSRYPGGPSGGSWPRTSSAGTEELARRSGGDSMPVNRASALEDTLTRIRQRYALYYQVPGDAPAGEERTIDVQLASEARRRFPDAEVRFRRVYLTPEHGGSQDPVLVSEVPAGPAQEPAAGESTPQFKRRRAVNEPGEPRSANPSIAASREPAPSTPEPVPIAPARPAAAEGGWKRVQQPSNNGGWRKATPEDLKQPQ